jgi:cell division protein FtsZ
MAIKLVTNNVDGAKIRVVGVGGGGGNIINNMVDEGINGVEFIAINTDNQVLELNKAHVKITIGKEITKGLGAGMDPEKGMKAAENSRDEITRSLEGSDMVFITAGMGGGTGTGAAPVVARIAKSLDALVVAIITRPFDFEGKVKSVLANDGIEKLKREVDSLIIIPNQRLIELLDDEEVTQREAFQHVDRVLYHSTRGISQIITEAGQINVDFADVRTTMKGMGDAMIGTGIASGPERAEKATHAALDNPLLENIDITGAKRVLTNICTNGSLKIKEFDLINKIIMEKVGGESGVILGMVEDPKMKEDELMVTLIATGFRKEEVIDTGATNVHNIFDYSGKSKEGNKVAETSQAQEQYEPQVKKPAVARKMEESDYHITEIPGDNDLKKLDKPAFERRGININLNEDFSETSKEKDDYDDFGFEDLNLDEDFQKPAFLRRQMD